MSPLRKPQGLFLSLGVTALLATLAWMARPLVGRGRGGSESQHRPARTQVVDARRITAPASASATAAGFDSERLWGPRNDWEPTVAADPSSPSVYQLTTRYDGPAPCKGCKAPWIMFRSSLDGGVTYGPDSFLTPYKKTHNDPEIHVTAAGAIYAVWLNDYNPGVKFTKSTDGGATWTTPVALIAGHGAPSWSDKPILAVSPDGQDVYVALNASDSWVVVSHDGGATFPSRVQTSDDGRYWFHTGGGVAPDGSVYFAATDYSQDFTGPSHVNVLRSTDGGASWTTTPIDTSQEAPDCAWAGGCYLGFFGPSAALAVDGGGRIMVAYNASDVAGAPEHLYVQTSLDGLSWSGRQEVGVVSGSVDHAFPALAAGPMAGDFRLAWQDDRNASHTGWNTWYRSTSDGGQTWSMALRLSDVTSGAPYKNAAGYAFPYGDYMGISVDSGGTAHVIWGEGTSWDGPGGTWYTKGE